MARTRNYATEEANYTDATLATSIDNKGTELRVDVREVVNQLIGVAESTALADPVVNQTNGTLNFAATVAVATQPLTQTQTYVRMYHPFGFTYIPNVAYNPTLGAVSMATVGPDFTFSNGYVLTTDLDSSGTAEAFTAFRDLDLPVGVTATEATIYFYRTTGTSQYTFYLYRFDPTTGTATQLGTATTSGSTTGSWLTQTMSLVDFTTSASYSYYLYVASGTGTSRFGGVKLDYTSPNANARI